MSKVVKLKKGLDIKLKGKADTTIRSGRNSVYYAVKPTDFRLLIPKLSVKIGDKVKAGDALFTDKDKPEIKFTSPVSGIIHAINRGERRKLLEVVVKADAVIEYKDFGKTEVDQLTEQEIRSRMLESGVWPMLTQRPFGILANPEIRPKAIFVSGFDSAPLAPDFEFSLRGELKNLQTGINCLKKICGKEINLALPYRTDSVFAHLKNTEITYFSGSHPAGNTGIQIHHLNPINKGEHVWTIDLQNLVILGRLFNEGRFDASKTIALTGSEVEKPAYVKTILGAEIASITDYQLKDRTRQRIISGNVLTGTRVEPENFLGFFDNQITVIPEGDEFEFLGWASPGINKFSATKLFPSFLLPFRKYALDANLHGEKRAFVLTGQYEKVFPMDIYPVYLLKSVLANDIDKMEQLGIYEVLPEDMALCEFVCTSKTPVQQILNQGIELMIRETN